MVRHHALIGLGFKRQNFRNRVIKYLMDRNILGSGMRTAVIPPSFSRPTSGSGSKTMRPAVIPPSYSRPTTGRGPLPAARLPLKVNY